MKLSYFEDTDTLYIEFKASDIAESRELDEDTIMDVDAQGNVCAITSSMRAGGLMSAILWWKVLPHDVSR